MLTMRNLSNLIRHGEMETVAREVARYGLMEGDSRWTEIDGERQTNYRATSYLYFGYRWSLLWKDGELKDLGYNLP